MNQGAIVRYKGLIAYISIQTLVFYIEYKDTLTTLIEESFELFNTMPLDTIVETIGEQWQEIFTHDQFGNAINEGFGEGASLYVTILVAILTFFLFKYAGQQGGVMSAERANRLCMEFADTTTCANIPHTYNILIQSIMNKLHASPTTPRSRKRRKYSTRRRIRVGGRRRHLTRSSRG